MCCVTNCCHASRWSMTDTVYRLHPLSWIFHCGKAIQKMAFPLIGAFVVGQRQVDWQVWILVPVALITIYSIFSARAYSYRISNGELLIHEGLFNKRQRHIPFARIHSVSQRHQLLHRLLGVTEVQLDSAAGNKPEAVMKVLSLPAATALEDLLRHADARLATQSSPASAGAAPLHTLPPAEIVRLGLVSDRGAILIAVVFGALMQNEFSRKFTLDLMMKLPVNWFRSTITAEIAEGHWLNLALAGLLMFAVAFVAFRILSIVLAFIRYHGFVLEQHGERLIARHGMSTKVRAGARLPRLQRFVLQETWMHRRLERCRLAVDVEGGHGREEQNGVEASAKFSELAPIATRAQAEALLKLCLPQLDWNTLDWRPLHPNALKRRLMMMAKMFLPVMALFTWVDYIKDWRVPPVDLAIVFLLVGVATVFYTRAWLRFAAVAESGELLLFRSGVWRRNWVIVHAERLQNILLVEAPADRRLGLVQLEADIQGGPRNKRALVIPCMARDDGEALRARLWQQIA
jgi:putative membrane protein